MKCVCINTRLVRTVVCEVIDYGLLRGGGGGGGGACM